MNDTKAKDSSESLAAIVFAHKAFGLFKEESRDAMIELMIRREAGDEFDFDQYIATKLKEMPKPQVNEGFHNVLSALNTLGGSR